MNLPSPLRQRLVPRWRSRAAELLQTLQHWPWLDTLKTLRLRFREDQLGLTAGSLTFTTLISLVPLLTVALALFSAFPMFATFQDALQKYFLQSLVPDNIARPVLQALTQFASKANRLGSVGLVFLVLVALSLVLTIDRTLNRIWRVKATRPIAQRVLVYWSALTLGPVLLGISLSMTSYAVSASKGVVQALPGGVALLFDIVEFASMAVGVSALFHYVPNTAVRWRHAIAGGVFVAVGIDLAKRLLGVYLGKVPTYSVLYGAFATVPIFLVWIYLVWVVILLGAVIAAYAPSLQMRVTRWPDGPGARLQLALAVLRELDVARTGARHGLSLATVSESLRIDPLQVEPVLDELAALDWVGRLEEGGDPRQVLLVDPATTPAEPLLARLLLGPTPGSRHLRERFGFDRLTLADLLRP